MQLSIAPQALSAAPATVNRLPQLPKTDGYPTYNGFVHASHRQFLSKIDQLKRPRQLSEVNSKLPSILKDNVSTWDGLHERRMPNASWTDWAQAIPEWAQNHEWRTHIFKQKDALNFPDPVPNGESRSGEWFIYKV